MVEADHSNLFGVRPPQAAHHNLQRAIAATARSSYTLARMRHEIVLAPEAVDDLKRMDARTRATATDAIEKHLRHEPEKPSRSRIKRLRGLRKPQYRLRVGAHRIFYDVIGDVVEILAVVSKAAAARWLDRKGERT